MKLSYSQHTEALTDLAISLEGAEGMLGIEQAPDVGYWQQQFLSQWAVRMAAALIKSSETSSENGSSGYHENLISLELSRSGLSNAELAGEHGTLTRRHATSSKTS